MRPENPEGKHLADAPSPQHQRYRDLMDSLGDGQAGLRGHGAYIPTSVDGEDQVSGLQRERARTDSTDED